jgi:hypothetical protein
MNGHHEATTNNIFGAPILCSKISVLRLCIVEQRLAGLEL